ncbi:hypothetical protein [Pseudooceanicola nanhaiensis]|uniref:hypothetical protein n=1 Tax=Pseudooceanicola nanhaiensis TaxID=375761 RepID=UPI001CD50A0C|nr:hypothetical protein [Pseudooceanicola nanhaiensis]MCA0919603.1 hypothetical protein [Pseudooceanicola nanhaiensis]
MPKLIRLYITHVLIGFGVAALFVAVLIGFNVANLRHLVSSTNGGLLAVFLLWFSNGIVFAGVQFAIAVMRLREDDGPSGGKHQPMLSRVLHPVRAEATAKPRR